MDGLLLIDKPAGMTSHDVVASVRRALGVRRVGHVGTLDPFATGLLLVLVGRATRVQRFLLELPKSYSVVARLGATSTTGDPEGEIVLTGRVPSDPPPLPTGEVRQRPPAYSAVKVAGERAYRRARRGEHVELPERTVTVYRFEQLWRREDRAAFEVECSSGTYVRSMIADLGDAYCEQLRRTAIGEFDVADALAPPARQRDAPPARQRDAPLAPLPLERALRFLPQVVLEPEAARRVAHGMAAPPDAGAEHADGPVLLLDELGAVAVAEWRESAAGRQLRPTVVLR